MKTSIKEELDKFKDKRVHAICNYTSQQLQITNYKVPQLSTSRGQHSRVAAPEYVSKMAE